MVVLAGHTLQKWQLCNGEMEVLLMEADLARPLREAFVERNHVSTSANLSINCYTVESSDFVAETKESIENITNPEKSLDFILDTNGSLDILANNRS